MRRAALVAACFLFLLPVLVIGAAGGGIEVAAPSSDALADIPAGYLALYEQAGLAYGIPWEVLAGIGKVECDHGRSPAPACWQEGAVNEAGAGGPMQFLAGTWAAYGVDADDDGQADRWDAADAVFSAANYLKASGAPEDLPGALFAYNHSQAYVAEVLRWAGVYRSEAPPPLTSAVPGVAALGDPAALAQAVLSDPNIALRPEAAADLRAGRVDSRVLAVLLALGRSFRLGSVGPFVGGHAYDVKGSDRPSNHAFGRAVDIGQIDGEPVSVANASAHAAARALASLPPALWPDEVGSPFADLTELPGFFSDADHRDHIHLGFDG